MELLPNGSSDEQNEIVRYDEDSLILDKARPSYFPSDASAEETQPRVNVGRLIRKYWLLVILFLILGAAGGFASVVLSSPSYQARLLLEVQNTGTTLLRNGNAGADNGDSSDIGIQTQISILRSASFRQRGADRMNQDAVPLAPTGKDLFSRLRQRIHPTIQDPLENAKQGLSSAVVSFDARPV